jgi:hypothetical protein
MKLKKFIKESISDDYVDEFQNYIASKYKNKKVNGWLLSVDRMSGTFYWDNPSAVHTIMATPFWDGNEKLPIDVMYDDDTELSTSFPFKPSGDMKKDEITYFKLMKLIFSKIK